MTDKITIERETLLPCPFCGAKAEILTIPEDRPDAGAMFVQCCDSRCMTSSALLYPLMDDVRALLVERWNRRAALAAQPAEQGMVRLPESAEEARAMALIGEAWLRQHAPEMLKPAQQAEPQEPVASYWLIECKNGFTGWYTSHRLDCRFFDTDPRKAYKFASKELAENEISERGHSCMIATEHVDIAALAAQPADPVAWINRRVIYDPATDSVTGYGEPELSFERASYGYDYANAKPLVLAQTAPAAVPPGYADELLDTIRDIEQHIGQGVASEKFESEQRPGYGTGTYTHISRKLSQMRAMIAAAKRVAP